MRDHPVDSVMFDFGVNEHRTAFIAAWNAGYEACREDEEQMDPRHEPAKRAAAEAAQQAIDQYMRWLGHPKAHHDWMLDFMVEHGIEPDDPRVDIIMQAMERGWERRGLASIPE